MKILYILPFVPWPLRVRSYNLIPRLAKRHEISLLCLDCSATGSEGDVRPLRPLCREIRFVRHQKSTALFQCAVALATSIPLRIAYFASQKMEFEVRRAIAEFSPDVIYVERWRALQYVPTDTKVPIVCDPTDSMLLYNERLMQTGSLRERLIGFEESFKFRRHEAELAGRVDAAVFCSRVDLEYVQEYAPAANLVLVPNGVDCRAFFMKEPHEEDPSTVVFTGDFHYSPNRHAVQFFLNEIYPLTLQKVPTTKFIAVGRGASTHLDRVARSTPGMSVVDFVPDLRSYVAKAAVAIAPIIVGAGVSNKVGQTFATGTAVVATRLACGDLPVRSGEHLFLADDPGTFSANVVSLLLDPVLRRRLAVSARRFIEENYDWAIVAARMERLLEETAHRRPRVLQPCTVDKTAVREGIVSHTL